MPVRVSPCGRLDMRRVFRPSALVRSSKAKGLRPGAAGFKGT